MVAAPGVNGALASPPLEEEDEDEEDEDEALVPELPFALEPEGELPGAGTVPSADEPLED